MGSAQVLKQLGHHAIGALRPNKALLLKKLCALDSPMLGWGYLWGGPREWPRGTTTYDLLAAVLMLP